MSSKLRVLVVDDSALMRKLIPQILETDSSIEVVGTAMDGSFGLKKIEDLKPQVVTLDLDMPGMNGIDMLKQVMRKIYPVPVLVVSSHSTEGASITLKALGLGAFDFVAKPNDVSTRMPEIAAELIAKIKAAANSKIVPVKPLATNQQYGKAPVSSNQAPTKIVTIGVSTGGPHALQYVFSQLPADFPGTILVVQHMPENFTEMFARRLDETCALRVKEAQSGDLLMPGRVLICPGNRHLKVKRLPLGNVALLSDEPRIRGHRPSADVLFRSAAEEFGPQTVAVIMTGMGDDGAEGLGTVKAAGGMTIAQSEESCVVYGMPKAAVDRGYAIRVVGLEAMATTLVAQCAPESGRSELQSGNGAGGKSASAGQN
jgi:two-component system, chemotaxis family, protein-glutamate methylesterase/glutaminase